MTPKRQHRLRKIAWKREMRAHYKQERTRSAIVSVMIGIDRSMFGVRSKNKRIRIKRMKALFGRVQFETLCEKLGVTV
jgi:hypothetical protein